MKRKNILVAGAGGLIGSAIAGHLAKHNILKAGREDFIKKDLVFVNEYDASDVIMNFSGTPVMQRWTSRSRKEIMDSRIGTTRKLGLILSMGEKKPRQYISASAIGIYSDEGTHDETSRNRGEGFMKDVVESWEEEAMKLEGPLSSVAILRLGVVLSRQGGIVKKLLPWFRMGLGARIGSGKQAFSWIHIEDLLRAVEYIMDGKKAGIYNLVSPGNCRNIDFTRQMGRALNKTSKLTVPSMALKLIYGKGAGLITGGQAVIPRRLIREGFEFKYKDLGSALDDIVN